MGLWGLLDAVSRRLLRDHDEGKKYAGCKSPDVISFHPTRGKDVSRSRDGTTVYKKKRFLRPKPTNALTFSSRPVSRDEVVTIDVSNVAAIVGLMYASPESVSHVTCSFDVIRSGDAFGIMIPKRSFCSVELHCNKDGDVCFKADGEEVALFLGILDPSVKPWVLIDMYNSMECLRAMSSRVTAIPISVAGGEKLRRCQLCCSASADATLGTCGHNHSCYGCAKRWCLQQRGDITCPFCRAQVTFMIKRWPK